MEFAFAGFIKEYDRMAISKPLVDCLGGAGLGDELLHCLAYLESGYLVLGWMEYFKDLDTGKSIEPFGYQTDGYWIWPAYLPYLLYKHSDFILDTEFLEHMRERDFRRALPKDFSVVEAEKALIKQFP